MENPSDQLKEEWRQDPKYWKLGMFYFNKEDKRFFPSKKIKQMGWTVNFAQPFSYFFLLGIFAIFFLTLFFIKK